MTSVLNKLQGRLHQMQRRFDQIRVGKIRLGEVKRSWLVAAAVTILATLWLASGQFGAGTAQQTASSAPTAPLPAVRVIQSAAQTHVETIRVLGHTEAGRKVDLRVEIEGRVVELPVARGEAVRAGDVLARLATEDRAARLQEAQALLRQRQVEFDAAKQLHAKGHRSDVQLAESTARLDGARAVVKRMEVEIANTVIRAPFDGVLDQRPAELGSYLKQGDAVGTIVDLDPLRVVGYVSEREVGRVRKGAPAQAELPGGRVLEGTVTFVGATADSRTRTFRVEIEVPNAENAAAEGLTAELQLPVGETTAHRISPGLLTLADDGAVGVKTVESDGTVQFFRIEPVANLPDGSLLVRGLPDTATLIAVGQEYVTAGQRVRAVPMASGAALPAGSG